MKERTLAAKIGPLLESHRKMIFVSGPRQVGKTTLAKAFGATRKSAQYFNWDVITDQKRLAKNPYFFEESERTGDDLVIFDEIHKYAKWKNYLKGAYDRFHGDFFFVVTGSGRLDLFRKGGDSLLGRYVGLPLFPFTLGEMEGRFPSFQDFVNTTAEGPPSGEPASENYRALFELGGFPEPLVKGEKDFYNIWRQGRHTLLLREDIRDATRIREISLLEMLTHLLPERIGSPLSTNSLREDLGVAFETVRDWIDVLARFYYLFKLTPYTSKLTRALRKEPKAYLFDWAELDDEGVRFENLVAMHLLKSVATWKALGAGDLDLHYVRDKERREVDFVLTDRRRPVCLIEAKAGDVELSEHLLYFQEKLAVPGAVQIVHKSGVLRKFRRNDKVQWVVSADRWLRTLP